MFVFWNRNLRGTSVLHSVPFHRRLHYRHGVRAVIDTGQARPADNKQVRWPSSASRSSHANAGHDGHAAPTPALSARSPPLSLIKNA